MHNVLKDLFCMTVCNKINLTRSDSLDMLYSMAGEMYHKSVSLDLRTVIQIHDRASRFTIVHLDVRFVNLDLRTKPSLSADKYGFCRKARCTA